MSEYQVNFNSALTVDGFGFRGEGIVSLDENGIEYRGKKAWSSGIKFIMWAVLWVVWLYIAKTMAIAPMTTAGMMSTFMPIFLIIFVQAVCKSSATLHLNPNRISNISVKKNKIRFTATSLDNKKAKAFLKTAKESDAKEISEQLETIINESN